MNLLRLFLRFAPLIAAALLILLAVMFWNSIAARFPWSAESRAHRAEQAAAHAELDASARSLEVTGQAEQAQRVDTFSHVLIETQAIATQGMAEARSAPDASTPLDPARSDRLRLIDDGLCDASPALAGCPAPAGASEGR